MQFFAVLRVLCTWAHTALDKATLSYFVGFDDCVKYTNGQQFPANATKHAADLNTSYSWAEGVTGNHKRTCHA